MAGLAEVLAQAVGRPVDTACDLIESLLGKPFKVAGEAIADQIQMWQWTNRVRIAEKVQKLLDQRKVARRVVPPDFLIPFIRDCGDAADEDLQDAWSNLLASAVEDDCHQHIGFLHTLKQLAPTDARVLNALIKLGPVDVGQRATSIAEATRLSTDLVSLSLSHLDHLGFFTSTGKRLKAFAIRFIRACSANREELDRYLEAQKEIKHAVVFD